MKINGEKIEATSRFWVRALTSPRLPKVDLGDYWEDPSGTRLADVSERQSELKSFQNAYEDMVETLCDAAQYGPTPKLELRYTGYRMAYQSTITPVLLPLRQYLVGESRSFESLCVAETLADFLANDDGLFISRITETREGLKLYQERLRQLHDKLKP